MTRFNIFLEDAVKMVDWALKNSLGGEIFVPKLDCYKIIDFIRALFPDAKIKEIGVRPGEKLHEEMITENDSNSTFDLGKYYAVVNKFLIHKIYEKYEKNKKIKKVKSGFFLSSNQQNNFLSIKQLKENFKNK